MPPVTKAGGRQFRKDVEFAATKESDEYELETVGIVMVPDKADLQNDFAREDTIRAFSEQFETFVEADQAGGGIMHAVWPDGWMDLTRNEVLDDAEDIAGRTVDAGAWVQRWGVNNADLAELIDDGVLSGYSIGAIQVQWDGPHEQGDLDDVDTSEVPDDEVVWELTDGIIREVSAVDIPAVPDAQILEAKDVDKRLADHIGNRDAFIEEAMERGHSEAEAERLWDVLNAAVEADGSDEPGKQSMFARAGKAFLNALSGSDDDTATRTSEAPDTAKEGRTLSAANQDDLKASIDAAVSILNDAGVDHGITRFTDREDDPFDLSEHQARAFDTGDDEDEDNPFDVQEMSKHSNSVGKLTQDEIEEVMGIVGGIFGADARIAILDGIPAAVETDIPDDDMAAIGGVIDGVLDSRVEDVREQLEDTDNDTESMTDSDPGGDEPPEWAKSLIEDVEQLKNDQTETSEKDVDPFEDAPEWAKELNEKLEQGGHSQQLGGGDPGAEKNDEPENFGDAFGKAILNEAR